VGVEVNVAVKLAVAAEAGVSVLLL